MKSVDQAVRLTVALFSLAALMAACGGTDTEKVETTASALRCSTCYPPPPPPPPPPPVHCSSGQKLCGEACIAESACCTTTDCVAPYNGSTACVAHACVSTCNAGSKLCADAIPANSCIPNATCCTNADCPIPNGFFECMQGSETGGFCYPNGPICNAGYSLCPDDQSCCLN
jgi:hypothetical protein